MEVIRKRRKSPETLRLVERWLKISRPRAMKRKFDLNAQRQISVLSSPNKRNRDERAELDGELQNRANSFSGRYQLLEEKKEESEQPQNEIEENEPESQDESQIIRSDNFPIVDLNAYNTEGKEAHFVLINQIIDRMTGDKKAEHLKKSKPKKLCSLHGIA